MLQDMQTDNLFLQCSLGDLMSPVNSSPAFELNICFLRQNKAPQEPALHRRIDKRHIYIEGII